MPISPPPIPFVQCCALTPSSPSPALRRRNAAGLLWRRVTPAPRAVAKTPHLRGFGSPISPATCLSLPLAEERGRVPRGEPQHPTVSLASCPWALSSRSFEAERDRQVLRWVQRMSRLGSGPGRAVDSPHPEPRPVGWLARSPPRVSRVPYLLTQRLVACPELYVLGFSCPPEPYAPKDLAAGRGLYPEGIAAGPTGWYRGLTAHAGCTSAQWRPYGRLPLGVTLETRALS